MEENKKNNGTGFYRVYLGDSVIPKKLPTPESLSDRRLHNMIDDIVRKHPERYNNCFYRLEGNFLHDVEEEGILDVDLKPFTCINNPYSKELIENRAEACKLMFYEAFGRLSR